MNSPRVALQWFGLTTLLFAIAGLAWMVMSPGGAEAQPSDNAILSIVAELDAEAGLVTATVGVDSSATPRSGLTAEFSYDTADSSFVPCSVSEPGACNDGSVLDRN